MLGFVDWRTFQQLREPAWNDRALASCDRALEINVRSTHAHACRGLVLHDFGRHTDALRALERAVERRSN